jgi:transcriptional regulator GlxA family with amidase domain
VKTVAMHIWQNMTGLDVFAPQQILGYVPDFDVVTVAKTMDPVVTDTQMRIMPDHDFETCPPVDILVTAGGVDPSPELRDEATISWLREVGASADYVTSVCTGSLLLAEAGLLDGYKATTHWAYTQHLASYPEVELAEGRVVTDRNRITAGGVTAGLDFALAIVAQIVGPDLAAALQLMGELPIEGTPFGDPATSPPELVAGVRAQFEALSPGLAEFLAAKA